MADSGFAFKDSQESLDDVKAANLDILPEGLSTENLIDLDCDVIVTPPCITEDEIPEQF